MHVTVHHFVSDAQPDLRLLDHVIRKVHEIRENLGSLNEISTRAVWAYSKSGQMMCHQHQPENRTDNVLPKADRPTCC